MVNFKWIARVISITVSILLISWILWGRVPWFFSTNYPVLFSDRRISLADKQQISQNFRAMYPGLYRVDIHFENQGKDSGSISFRLKNVCTDVGDLVSIIVPESQIEDNAEHRFEFHPIDESAFKEYCLVLEPLPDQPVDQLAVFASRTDIYPDGAASYIKTKRAKPSEAPSLQFKPTHFVWLPAVFSNFGAENSDFDLGFNVYYAGPVRPTLQALFVNLARHKTSLFGQPWFYPLIFILYVIAVALLLGIVWRGKIR